MSFELDFSDQALEDLLYHKKAGDKTTLKKIAKPLTEIAEHPLTGTGKPEALKYNLSVKWSRRINNEHRIVYTVLDNTVNIYSAKGHY